MRVLVSSPRNADTNPYILSLFRALEAEGVDVLPWSLRTALLGRYDVVHVHWPEQLYRKRTRLRTAVAVAVFIPVLVRWALLRTPLVWTVHNDRPHEPASPLEHLLLRRTLAGVRRRIRLLPDVGDEDAVVIPHGDYREHFRGAQPETPEPGLVVAFGHLREYKGFERAIDAFGALADRGWRLEIEGRPATADYGAALQRRAQTLPNVDVRARYLADADLARLVTRSTAVLLTYPAMSNSGALLLALSLGRPVIATDSPANRAIAVEVGPGWLFLVPVAYGAVDLERALRECTEHAHDRAPDGPSFRGRDWSEIGRRHKDVFESVTRMPEPLGARS